MNHSPMLTIKYPEPDPIFIPVSVRGPNDLIKFERLRREKKYEVALNRAYFFRAIRPSFQTRVLRERRRIATESCG